MNKKLLHEDALVRMKSSNMALKNIIKDNTLKLESFPLWFFKG